MNNSLPFFNWSLKRALDTEPDSFIKARIRIIYTILLFALLKIAVAIVVTVSHEQWSQLTRAVVAAVLHLLLVKLVLYRPDRIKVIAHFMMIFGLLLICTNIFVFAQKINLLSIQFIFMIMLSSFYVLGRRPGLIYTPLSILPVVVYMFTEGNLNLNTASGSNEIASPAMEIIAILNFVSIGVAHYLFYRAFTRNFKEKEALNLQLQASIAEANKLAASKSNFLSTMSHELRTPLNSVIGITELLQEDNPEERQKENLKILQSSSRDLLALINNILDFNKIDSDKLVLETVTFPLAEFVQTTCSGLKVRANDKKLDFILDIDQPLMNTHVVSDPTRLSQLIYNLAGNAIKFTEKGSVTIRLKFINKTSQEVDVLFSIIDTGIGIHPDKHETIFESFTQAESHTTRKYGGTGLGLAIVQQVLTLFNSALKLESIPDKGTTFSFRIPFAIAVPVQRTEAAREAAKADLSHLKILIAEDNDVNRLLIKKQLEKLNISATIVENGLLAYEAYKVGDFDVILMDLHMPVADGYETIRQIRALPNAEKSSVYIIAFTASVSEQQQIADAGFNDYLYKPVNMKALHDKLEKIATKDREMAAM